MFQRLSFILLIYLLRSLKTSGDERDREAPHPSNSINRHEPTLEMTMYPHNINTQRSVTTHDHTPRVQIGSNRIHHNAEQTSRPLHHDEQEVSLTTWTMEGRSCGQFMKEDTQEDHEYAILSEENI